MFTNRKNNGFTLVELMIALVIVAILAAIALPSYQDSVLKAKRADAKDILLRIAQTQERHFTQWARYASNLSGGAGATNLGLTADDLESQGGDYNVTLTNPGATTYTLVATPNHADADCGNLTLTQDGERDVTGSSAPEDCW